MSKPPIAILGGAGYIGSHTCYALAQAGYQPIVIDNLSRGHKQAVKWGPLEHCDIRDTERLTEILKDYNPAAVIHFAALIEVAESVKNPEEFRDNNVNGTRSVLSAMQAAGVNHIVFSSTAAVYGQPKGLEPITETSALEPINPYGATKLAAEKLIQAAPLSSVCLRYFNASGAAFEEAGIGEMHYPESHLIPLAIQKALGLRASFAIFGTNYDTPDGTAVRDYIHVLDLAAAHIKALEYLLNGGENLACNLGTGTGLSVLEIVKAVETTHGRSIEAVAGERRAGDPSSLVANPALAEQTLNWKAERSIGEIVKSAYEWHNSDEYREFWASKTA